MNEENQSQEKQTVKHMASVKAAWDKVPEGPKKATALKHYQAAEKANEADNDEAAQKGPQGGQPRARPTLHSPEGC